MNWTEYFAGCVGQRNNWRLRAIPVLPDVARGLGVPPGFTIEGCLLVRDGFPVRMSVLVAGSSFGRRTPRPLPSVPLPP